MILLIDNYDSFVFNLARYFRELGCEVVVTRNDHLTVTEVEAMQPSTPNEAGISLEVVRQFGPTIPLLGVCLGHQTIAAALGGEVVRAVEPIHGRTSLVEHDSRRLFAGLPNPLAATRYHSLIVSESTLPACLRPTARTRDGALMAFEHIDWPTFGVQFHPESVLTTGGHRLLQNFLALSGVCPDPARELSDVSLQERRETQAPAEVDWNSIGPLHW